MRRAIAAHDVCHCLAGRLLGTRLDGKLNTLGKDLSFLVWINASTRWGGGLVDHLTPYIVNFYRGMGLLTKEEEKRFL